jgi:hypothetical protein
MVKYLEIGRHRQDKVAHTCNPSTQEAETGNLRAAWATQKIPGQTDLHIETLFGFGGWKREEKRRREERREEKRRGEEKRRFISFASLLRYNYVKLAHPQLTTLKLAKPKLS